MGNRKHDRIILAVVEFAEQIEFVFMSGFFSADPGIVHIDAGLEVAEFVDDIDDARIAQIGAIFLEREAENEHL